MFVNIRAETLWYKQWNIKDFLSWPNLSNKQYWKNLVIFFIEHDVLTQYSIYDTALFEFIFQFGSKTTYSIAKSEPCYSHKKSAFSITKFKRNQAVGFYNFPNAQQYVYCFYVSYCLSSLCLWSIRFLLWHVVPRIWAD